MVGLLLAFLLYGKDDLGNLYLEVDRLKVVSDPPSDSPGDTLDLGAELVELLRVYAVHEV